MCTDTIYIISNVVTGKKASSGNVGKTHVGEEKFKDHADSPVAQQFEFKSPRR